MLAAYFHLKVQLKILCLTYKSIGWGTHESCLNSRYPASLSTKIVSYSHQKRKKNRKLLEIGEKSLAEVHVKHD